MFVCFVLFYTVFVRGIGYHINALLVYNFLFQIRVILNRHSFLSLLQLNILRVMSQNEKERNISGNFQCPKIVLYS